MFDLLDARKPSKPYMSRRVAVWGLLVGAFAMGLGAGKLLAGAKPFDWTLEIMTLVFLLGWTIWCAFAAARRDDAASDRDVP